MNAPHNYPANIIDGKALADATNAQTARHAAWLSEKGVNTHMAIVLVGENEASEIYVAAKRKAAQKAGINATLHRLPSTVDQAALLAVVEDLSNDADINGIIVQMPLPPHLDADAVLNAVSPAKDIDGLTTANLELLAAGTPNLVPCTPQGCMMLIRTVKKDLAGLKAVVVGRSRLVGKPLAQLLEHAGCTVTVIHSKTPEPAAIAADADILCVAAGRAGLITADWVKQGAIVIDVGINRQATRIVGDVDFEAVAQRAGAITPVPKGVGPMTIACLLRNTIYAAAKQYKLALPELDDAA